jgi:hypothetical protein
VNPNEDAPKFRVSPGEIVYTATISNESSCDFQTYINVPEYYIDNTNVDGALSYIDADGKLNQKGLGDIDDELIVIPACTSVTLIIRYKSNKYVDKFRECCGDNEPPIIKAEVPIVTVVLYGEFLKPSTTAAASPTPCSGKVFLSFSNKH